MLKHLLPYLRPYRKQFIIGPSFKLFEAILELTLPMMMASIIDIGIAQHDRAYIMRIGLRMIVTILIGFGSALICQYCASVASQGFGTRVRSALFSHVNHLSFAELDAIGTDTLTTRVTNDVNQLQVAVSMLIRLISRAPFVSIGCIVAAMMLDLPLSTVIWVGVISFILVLAVLMITAFPLYGIVQMRLDDIGGVVRENFAGVRVIRAFARGSVEMERFVKVVDAHAASVIRVTRIASLMNPMTALIMNGVICAILWFGAIRVQAGGMSTGQIIAFINYIAQILTALITVANLVVIFTRASASLRRVNEIFALEPSVHAKNDDMAQSEAPGASEKSGASNKSDASDTTATPQVASSAKEVLLSDSDAPAIAFSGVHFSYGENPDEDPEKKALTDISFSVPKGSVLGIIGATGSGKTTVLSLIARFYDVQKGQVRLLGSDARNLSPHAVRKHLGCVFQNPRLFSGTVAQNLRWGDPDATRDEIRRACDCAQASDFIEAMPEKYDSWIERDGRNLSGGQRQRLSIARALTRRPPVLLLDDASSALDYATEARLRDALTQLRHTTGMTVVMVSQRIASIMGADQILVLEDGRQMGIGTHKELMETCGTYRSIVFSQMSKEEVG